MYHSAPSLQEFYDRVKKEAEKITDDYEIIFVNDGSPDDSLKIAVAIHEKDDKVVVVDLSRNFGHYKAMMTGLSFAKGEKVFLVDCDLEEEPELLSLFYEKFNQVDCDVVYGVQKSRKGGFFERISGSLFFTIFNFLSNVKIPRNTVVARLMSRRYVKSLISHKESELLIGGLWQITGYEQVPVTITKHSKGSTKYGIRLKIATMVNAITSFSDRPLIYIFYSGMVISLVATIYMIRIFLRKIFFGISVSGWTSLIVSVWFLGGLTILFLGIIGIYLSKIFTETKNRPYSIVRELYSRDKDVQK